MEGGMAEILALSDLLANCNDSDDYQEHDDVRQTPMITPASMTGHSAPVVDRPIGQIKPVDSKAIWLPEEVPSDDEDDDTFDTRRRPTFEILYKQSVMTEDVFLGLSDKDPSSAHCEAMVVRVDCPKHRLEDIELDVKKQKLLLHSSTLKLSLYLPYPVRYQDGQAQWDAVKQTLSIRLPIIRDEW
ncbi:hypothetical protein Poli38472_000161 [Pythium oligandrum]|uniref:PIH1D1/2/3 CS-like domain-containing protein n=1 Tax=Pythium oligandrum TaxID=41045 RepID=A0A8K1FGL0_PYTOL|nr:hypothetical protein Poli38472_000161 [Pythium oligandrum]|eukprot:TMW60119.1 hypothetical protein Poli38472_000161 [Pythium oligandrum]